MIDTYNEQKECLYKNEKYAVRDNGAILRYPRDIGRVRINDNQWTYGKLDSRTGYMEIAGERVHRIVATAFHGDAPGKDYVVDHIDTNRQNNRPNNLRWVTKFENIFLNPITCKKIESVCGCSIEAVLKDISILQRVNLIPEFSWMRTVSEVEANASREKLLKWAASDKKPSGGIIGEWIYAESKKERYSAPVQHEVKTALDTNGAKERVRYSSVDKSKFPQELPDYPFVNDGIVRLRKKVEVFEAVERIFMDDPSIMLPDLIIHTCGSGILIEKACLKRFDNADYIFGGKARIPKRIILRKNDYNLCVIIGTIGSSKIADNEQYDFGTMDVIEVDMSWAKEGLSEEELKKIIRENYSKKKWVNNSKLCNVEEKLISVCEPIFLSGRGVLHSYVANCPLMTEPSNGRNDADYLLDCSYCDYRFENEEETGGCFGKSKVDTVQSLLSVIDVIRKDGQIVEIKFNKNGETDVKKFMFYDEETDALGKTLFELWNEKNGNKLIAHNVISDWYVLIEEDPKKSLSEKGAIYAKISKSIEKLQSCFTRSIFGYDNKEWEIVNNIKDSKR